MCRESGENQKALTCQHKSFCLKYNNNNIGKNNNQTQKETYSISRTKAVEKKEKNKALEKKFTFQQNIGE